MPRVVAAREAKNKLGEMFAWAEDQHDTVIVENRGVPKAVIMAYREYEELAKLKEQERRREIWAKMEKLREKVQAQNPDITSEESEQIADEFSRDLVNTMIHSGKVKYKGT